MAAWTVPAAVATVYAEIPTVHAAVATVHAAVAEARRSAAEASIGIAAGPAVGGALSMPAGEAPALVGVTPADSVEAAIPAATVRPASGAVPTFSATVHAEVGEPAIPVGAVRILVPPAAADAVRQRVSPAPAPLQVPKTPFSVICADQVRNTMQRVDLQVSAARPGGPSLRRGIWMGVELTDHDRSREKRRAAEVDAGLPARHLATNCNLPGGGIHVDPAALLMTSHGIVRSRIQPRLLECLLDRRMIRAC